MSNRNLWGVTLILCGAGIAALWFAGIYVYHHWLSDEGRYDGRTVSELTDQLLNDTDPGKRGLAANSLGQIGAKAKDAIPDLCKALRADKEEVVRADAALALFKIASEVRAEKNGYLAAALQQAVPALSDGLKDEFPFVRINSALALSQIGPTARQAVPALMEAFKDPDNRVVIAGFFYSVRHASADALGNIGPDARDAIPMLIEALSDEEIRTKWTAARALGNIGSEAKGAVKDLKRMLKDDDETVREQATNALIKIDKEEAAKAGIKNNSDK